MRRFLVLGSEAGDREQTRIEFKEISIDLKKYTVFKEGKRFL